MDALDKFLLALKEDSICQGRFLGLIRLLVAYKIYDKNGDPVSLGVTFRTLAEKLKKARWDTSQINVLGINPKELPQRDRYRFWYVALVRSKVNDPAAIKEADDLANKIMNIGYQAIAPHKQ